MHPNTPSTGTNTQKDGKTRAAVRYAAVMQVDEHKGAAMTNLSDIEKRCEAASPGEWESALVQWDISSFKHEVVCGKVTICTMPGDGPQSSKDADFIAEAKKDLPALLSMVQDLQSKLATAEGLVALQQEQIGGMQRNVGELEADARRYRWIRAFPNCNLAMTDDRDKLRWIFGTPMLDDAIDAALSTETTG